MRIRNHGNTPARITRALVQYVVAVEPLAATPLYDEAFAEPIDVSLVKGDHVDLPKVFHIPVSDLQTVRSACNNFAECTRPWRLFVLGYVDYIDRFDMRHRAGYARVFDEWTESKGIQPDDPTVMNPAESEERHRRRNNLVFISQAGYNYDRLRKAGEGNDW